MRLLPAALFFLLVAACSTSKKSSSQETSPTTFKLRDYKTDTWQNGLQVIVVEDHALPSVSYGLLVKDGSAGDPMAKSGVMHLTARVMPKGTVKKSALEVAESLGQLGSEFEQTVSEDFTWFQVGGLSPHQDELARMFSEVILSPRFDEKEVKRERELTLAAHKHRLDHPEQLAAEAFSAYLFGSHPYSRPVSGLDIDLKSLTREDLIRTYKARITPNNSVLVICGDVNSETIGLLRSTFEKWEKKEVQTSGASLPPGYSGIMIRLIDKPDLTQSQIVMGGIGIKRSDPDFLKLRVANVILGGNFSSRLMDQIRINLGLTYGISSSFDAKLERGPFEITTFTKNETVGKIIEETLHVLKKFHDQGVTDQEVEAAKNYLMGAFPRAIETPEKTGLNLALLNLYGISDDYLRNFVANIAKISTSDVNLAIHQHLDVDNLRIVVLSKAAEALNQVRPLGLVELKKFNEIF